jgi:hypothetical protein
MDQRSMYPSIPSNPSFESNHNTNTDEELLDILAQIERSRSQNYAGAASSSQASASNRLPASSSRTFPSSSALAASSALSASSAQAPAASASARAGVLSASAHTPDSPSTVSLYDELVRYQSEHGIQDENDADILESTRTTANATKPSHRRSASSTATSFSATATHDGEQGAARRRGNSDFSSTSMHSSTSTTVSTTSDRKLPARQVVPSMSGATYRKPISRNLFSSSSKAKTTRASVNRGNSFNDGNGSVHDNGIDIDEINDYHPGKQRSLSPAPLPSLPYGGHSSHNTSTSTRSTSLGSLPVSMPMPSQAQRHSSLPSQQTRQQTSSISDPGDLSEWYDDDVNDHTHLPPAVAREQSSVLDQDEALARRLQSEFEGLSRHHSSSATMKSDEILSRQMEELMREQERDGQDSRRALQSTNSNSHSGQQRQHDQQQQQQSASMFANSAAPNRNSNSNTGTSSMMGSDTDEGMMNAEEIEEQRKILLQIEEEHQARKQNRTSLVAPMTTMNSRRSLTTAAPPTSIPARNTSMPTLSAGDSHEAEEQSRILQRIREAQECEELAQALNLSRETSHSSPPPPSSSMAIGATHGNRHPSFPGVGATWESRQNPNPQRSSISGGGTGAGSAAEYLQSQHAAMTEYERRGSRPDPNAHLTGNAQRSQSLNLPADYNHNQQQYNYYNNNNPRPHASNANHHYNHNTNNDSFLNSRSSSAGSHRQHNVGDESHLQQQDMVRRGLVETQRAVQEGRAHVVQCQGCGERLQAPVSYSLVYCPTCGVISPGQSAHNNNSNSNNNNNNNNNNSGSSSSAHRGHSFHHEGHNDRYTTNTSTSAQRGQSFHNEGQYNNNSNNSYYNSGSSHSAQRGQIFQDGGHNDRRGNSSYNSSHNNGNNGNSGSSPSAQRPRGQSFQSYPSFHDEGHDDPWL